MLRTALIFLFFISAFVVKAQDRIMAPNTTPEQTKVIKSDPLILEESEYNFGEIPQGRPVTHVFKFKNNSSLPMILNDVHASCGCTTPIWSRDTIPAGGSSSIKVGFNASAEGNFVKPIIITYNGDQTRQLIIKGNVWRTPLQSAPENELVNQLNKK